MDEDMLLSPVADRRPRRSLRWTLAILMLGVVLGGALVAWVSWHQPLEHVMRDDAASGSRTVGLPLAPASPPADAGDALKRIAALDSQARRLEDRLSRIDTATDAAAVNAARVENLLVAVTVRRTIERGEPLGPLANQLALRFGASRPNAVRAVTAFAARPVTLSQLDARLDGLAPILAEAPRDPNGWVRLRREFSSLFVVRSETASKISPEARVERAKLLLASARTDEAVAEVAQLPGAAAAASWSTDARRYGEAQAALYAIEVAAMNDARAARGLQPSGGVAGSGAQ